MRLMDLAALSPFVLASCGGDAFMEASSINDSGADVASDAGMDAEAATSDGWPTLDSNADHDAVIDGDANPFADAGDASESGPVTPPAPVAQFYSDAACPFPASISYDAPTNTLLMACGANGSQPNGLFRSQPLGQGNTWTLVGQAKGYPSYHIALNDSYYLITHSAPHGFSIIDGKTGITTGSVDFSAISPLDPLYAQIKSNINSPAGAVLVGGQICVATSNLDQIDPNDPSSTTFHQGSVICMPYNYDGTVSVAYATALLTSGLNPTAMALIDSDPVSVEGGSIQRFAVLSSNSYANDPADDAKLDVIDINSGSMNSITLGKVTAQTTPALAMTEDGASFIVGVQKPSSQFLGVNWSDGNISYPPVQLVTNGYVYGASVFGKLALVTDSGVFGDPSRNGALFISNVDPAGWQGTLVTKMPGLVGAGVAVNGKYYATVTVPENSDAGNDKKGEIYVTDLGGLQ